METNNASNSPISGFTLLQICGAVTLITMILAMGTGIYFSAKRVSEKTPVIEDAESLANSLNVFYLTHGVLPETFVAVTGAKAYDPWANFYIYDSCSQEAQVPQTTTRRAIFIQDQQGRVFADMDGDGTIDVSTEHLDPEILLKLEDMSVPLPSSSRTPKSN